MEIEQEAITLGWVPQDQFKGDPAKWTDAETFVARGKEKVVLLPCQCQFVTNGAEHDPQCQEQEDQEHAAFADHHHARMLWLAHGQEGRYAFSDQLLL